MSCLQRISLAKLGIWCTFSLACRLRLCRLIYLSLKITLLTLSINLNRSTKELRFHVYVRKIRAKIYTKYLEHISWSRTQSLGYEKEGIESSPKKYFYENNIDIQKNASVTHICYRNKVCEPE